MAKFTLAGDPQVSGTTLTWSAVLDPSDFEMAAAESTLDTIDCWKMTANDAAGLDVDSELVLQCECRLPQDVMPGDSYTNSVPLDLPYGYYHVVLTVDSDNGGATHELHVRSENGALELKSWHTSIA